MSAMCSICLEKYTDTSYDVKYTSCGHLFHRECLYKWLGLNTNCPTCRQHICMRSIKTLQLTAPKKFKIEKLPSSLIEEKAAVTYSKKVLIRENQRLEKLKVSLDRSEKLEEELTLELSEIKKQLKNIRKKSNS